MRPPSISLRRRFALSLAACALATCGLMALAMLRGSSGGYRLVVPPVAAPEEPGGPAGAWRPLYNRSGVPAQPVLQLLPYLPDTCSGRAPCLSFGSSLFHRWRLWLREADAWLAGGGQAACGVPCDLVSDTSVADAVLFHGRDLGPQVPALRRRPGQRWVYLNQESPIATKRIGYDVSSDPKYRFLFNWSATTSLTSSIHLGYGSWERRQHQLEGPLYSPGRKSRMAFAVFSNCKYSFIDRVGKVAELQKHMQVDVYGGCGHRSLPRNFTVFQQVSEQYRFYLSFENAFCRDYITEKFHRNGLSVDAVPVVFGGLSRADYEAVSPPHSFVYALDFTSMRHLADHLTALAADETRYAEFFNWKRRFQASPRAGMLCAVCTKLHRDRAASVADLSEYYDVKRNCRPAGYQYLV